MKHYIISILALFIISCSQQNKYIALQQELKDYSEGKDANIGIAVIIDGADTVAVNGQNEFPMQSVYKFPIALVLAEHCRQNNLSIDHPVAIFPDDLHPDTYSPMTEKILASSSVLTDTLMMPASELLGYMLQHSDNNASDIALRCLGSIDSIERYLSRIGISNVHVRNSEAEMHTDNTLCYANSATPVEMACLMDKFDCEFNDSISLEIKRMMETCRTGMGRLAKPIMGTDAVIGHKTGTGFTLPSGRIMAVNDAGYIHLPNGHRYAIAVFIENSGYDMAQTETIIAEISEIVYKALSTNTHGY